MAKTIGYMITFTTYGTWLQGKEQGFVKDGNVRGANRALMRSNINELKYKAVRLNQKQREIVIKAIIEASKRFRQKILAIAVYSNHVHIVAAYVDVPISIIAGYYKKPVVSHYKKADLREGCGQADTISDIVLTRSHYEKKSNTSISIKHSYATALQNFFRFLSPAASLAGIIMWEGKQIYCGRIKKEV